MARAQSNSVPLAKILGWGAGIVAILLSLALSGAVANLFSRINGAEISIQKLEIARAASDATGTIVIERLTKIESKLDELQKEVLLQRKK